MVMKSRLNITIDEKLLTGAKRFANRHNTSLSQLVETYFKRITGPNRKNVIDLIESLPKPGIDTQGDLKKKYYEDQKSKYGF
jgi:Family of unknown function (DUF6364)